MSSYFILKFCFDRLSDSGRKATHRPLKKTYAKYWVYQTYDSNYISILELMDDSEHRYFHLHKKRGLDRANPILNRGNPAPTSSYIALNDFLCSIVDETLKGNW